MASVPDVLYEASRLRGEAPCSFAENPRHEQSHSVRKIVFEDSIHWAARVIHNPDDWEYELQAIKNFQHIKNQHLELKAPSVFFNAEHPVLYSDWVSGDLLGIWNLQIPLLQGQGFLEDLAEFLLRLWTTLPPPDLTPVQNHVYSDWLIGSLDRGLRRTLTGSARWGNSIDYLIMRSMIPSYASEFDKYTGVGFSHGDLNAHNVMKSDDFQLTGYAQGIILLYSVRSCSDGLKSMLGSLTGIGCFWHCCQPL
ncbi:hypothetical protein BJX99DRAFT_81975 [Aspergillus californicus]